MKPQQLETIGNGTSNFTNGHAPLLENQNYPQDPEASQVSTPTTTSRQPTLDIAEFYANKGYFGVILTTLIASIYEQVVHSDSKSALTPALWCLALSLNAISEYCDEKQLASITTSKLSNFFEFVAILSMCTNGYNTIIDHEDWDDNTLATFIAGSLFAVSMILKFKPESNIQSSVAGTAAGLSVVTANVYPEVSIPGIAVGATVTLWQAASAMHAWKSNSSGNSDQTRFITLAN